MIYAPYITNWNKSDCVHIPKRFSVILVIRISYIKMLK